MQINLLMRQWMTELDKHSWIFYFILAFGAGILFRSFFVFGIIFVLVPLALAFSSTFFLILRKQHLFFLLALVLFGFSLGILRMEFSSLKENDPTLMSTLGGSVELVGVVVAEPDLRDRNQLIVLEVEMVNQIPARGRVLVTADPFEQLSYGNRLRVSGVLSEPENFETDSGRIFNYVEYLGKDDIHFRMLYPDVEVTEQKAGNVVLSTLFSFKKSFLHALSAVLPEPEVSLLGGLLLGVKQSLGVELLEAFRTTGLVHLIVLSGYNISIIISAVTWVFAFFPAVVSVTFGGFLIVLFALVTGGSATIIRASMMAMLIFIARITGRVYEVTRALFVTGFLMLLHNPKLLAFDPSFQLSFLATLGLIQLAPHLERYVTLVPKYFGLREALLATLSTQLAVLPLLLYQTGTISAVAVFANLLVLPVVPLTMLLGFVTGVVSLLSVTLALPFALLTDLLLSYILVVTETLAQAPHAAIAIKTFPSYAMAVVYVAGVAFFYFMFRAGKQKAEAKASALGGTQDPIS